MKRVAITLGGMSCDHCVQTVDQALRSVSGVASAQVTLNSAVVEFDESNCSVRALGDAIRAAGYSMTGFRAANDLPAHP